MFRKSHWLHRSFLLLIMAVQAPLLQAQPPSAPSTLKKSPAATLAEASDVVLVGRVGSLESRWNADRSMIVTHVTIEVGETIKGDAGGSKIVVAVPGGEVGEAGEWYSHTPRFTVAEEVLLFATKSQGGSFRVTGGEQGKLTVERDPETGTKVIPNVGSLQAFTGHLRSVKSKTGDTSKERE
jgi:hypothetical protein